VASTDDAAPVSPEEGYPGTVVAAAVLATLFFPLISLIAALLLLGREQAARKRQQLRSWAWASVAWIALQVVVFLLLFAAVWTSSDVTPVSRAGPCVGGPVLGQSVPADENGRAVVPCAFGGTTTVTVP